jgi:5-methylcytosine-specific restriction enzyme subunit McrC
VFQTIELTEYETRRVRSRAPTESDLKLAEALSAFGDLEPRLEVRWLTGGRVEVKAASWVGIVRFSGLEIRIVPKLVGGTLGVLRMLEYGSGVRLLARLPSDRQLPAEGTDLFELIVMLLVEEAKSLVRDGLIRDYRPTEETLTVMRGRLRMREQYLRRYGSLDRLECSFDEYDGDIPENQLVAAALSAAGTRVQGRGLRADVRMLDTMIRGACNPTSRDSGWYRERIGYGRRNSRYRPAHELALLVLDGLALRDLFDTSSTRTDAFMLNMNVVFERFVTRLVSDSLAGSGMRVSTQESFRTVVVDEDSGDTYSSVRPDLVIVDTATSRAVPVDVKYKLYDRKKIGIGDVYQLFLYAYALGGDSGLPTAGVIYPSAHATSGPRLKVQPIAGSFGAHIRGAGLDVPSALASLNTPTEQQLHTDVLALVREITGLHKTSLTQAVNRAQR